MLNNNISNRKAPSILFRVEDFLVKYRETTTIDKILNKLIGKHKRAELNEEVVDAIDKLFRVTDFTVGLVCFQSDWNKLPKDLREIITLGMPVADVHLVHDNLAIEHLLQSGKYLFYVDDNLDNHTLVGWNRCFTLSQLNTVIKKGLKYEY